MDKNPTNQPPTEPAAEAPAKNKGGRPLGALSRLTRENIEWGKRTGNGELPHQFLARVARGEVIRHDSIDPLTGEVTECYQIVPFEVRVDAAKAAAPYFAPKLATVEIAPNLSDDEVLALLTGAVRELGGNVPALLAGLDQEEDDDGTEPIRPITIDVAATPASGVPAADVRAAPERAAAAPGRRKLK